MLAAWLSLPLSLFLSAVKNLVCYPPCQPWGHGVFSCVDREKCTHSPDAKAVPAMEAGRWVIEGSSADCENPTAAKMNILCVVEHSLDWRNDSRQALPDRFDHCCLRWECRDLWRLNFVALGNKSGGIPGQIEMVSVVILDVAERPSREHQAG